MIEEQMGLMGPFITELRADAGVAFQVGSRVRGFEPDPGDVQPKESWRTFVVLVILDAPPEPRVPLTFATLASRCYGVTPQGAWAVYGALAKAIHNIGARVKSNGLGIYNTLVISGGEQGKDPDTSQPVVLATIRLVATTQAVAV